MLYHIVTINNKDYKCRLSARALVDLEKKMGTNPLNIFMAIATKQEVPPLDALIQVFHASLLQFNHGISIDDAYEIYDEFIDEGHNMMDLIPIIMDVFKVSGLLPEEEAEEPKNAPKVIKK